jgi:hypothetical protein
MSKHVGYFTNPGVIAANHLKTEHALTPWQQSLLDQASEESGFTWRIRTVPAPPSNRYGRRASLGETRAFASAADQRAYWVDLITKNQKPEK